MRANVTFPPPAKFRPLSGDDDILSVGGARWLVLILSQIAGLQVDAELCQEDWVSFFSQTQSTSEDFEK
jgi:hypothetical protein